MFSKLKRPALALAVTAGLLAVAGPASAHVGIDDDFIDRVATGLKYETEVTDYVRLGTASDGHQGSPVSLVDKDLYQPDMTVREHPTQVGSSEVFELNTLGGNDTLRTPPALIDRTTAEDSFTSLPELHANDNAFMPEVQDEVLAGVNYEIDVFW